MRTMKTSDMTRKGRKDPQRLKAFAEKFHLMLADRGVPDHKRASAVRDTVGVSTTTAGNWLRGDSYPSFEEFGRISQGFKVDPAELLPDSVELAPRAETLSLQGLEATPPLARLIQEAQVLMLSRIKTSDGAWDHTALPNEAWSRLLGSELVGYVLTWMRGRSMGATIRDGAALLVDTTQSTIAEDNEIYALLVGKTILIRRVRHRLQGGYSIVADNPEIPDDTIATLQSHQEAPENPNDVIVLGRVTLAIQKL